MKDFDVMATTSSERDVTQGLRSIDTRLLMQVDDGTGPRFTPRVEPGAICPLCHEKTPNKHALEMRKFRAKRKEKP